MTHTNVSTGLCKFAYIGILVPENSDLSLKKSQPSFMPSPQGTSNELMKEEDRNLLLTLQYRLLPNRRTFLKKNFKHLYANIFITIVKYFQDVYFSSLVSIIKAISSNLSLKCS